MQIVHSRNSFAQAAAESLESQPPNSITHTFTHTQARWVPGSKQSLQRPLTSCSCCALQLSLCLRIRRSRSRRQRRRHARQAVLSCSLVVVVLFGIDYVALAPTKMAASSAHYRLRAHTHVLPHRFDSLYPAWPWISWCGTASLWRNLWPRAAQLAQQGAL